MLHIYCMKINAVDTPAGTRFVLSYYDSAKRGNIRKRFKSEKEAKAHFKTVEKGRKLAIPPAILQAPADVLNDITAALARIKGEPFTLVEAVDHYLGHTERKKALKPLPPFTELLRLFLNDRKEAGLRPRSIEGYDNILRGLEKQCACTLGVATRDHLKQALTKDSWSATSKNTYLRHAKVFYGWLVEERYRDDNPAEKLKAVEVEQTDPCIYDVEQTEKLLRTVAEVAPQFVRFYAIALFTGIRPDGIAKLTEDDIDLERGLIRVGWHADKTRSKYYAEIPDNLRAWLEAYSENQSFNMTAYFRREILKHSGLEHGHDILRHTFASHCLVLRGLEKTVAALNHTNPKMLYKHYRAAVPPQDGQRYFEIRP